MAWIKIDHTTPDKPEVMQIADALGITPEQAFGHLCRIWIWADQQSLNGHAIVVTEKGLDRIARHSGFASAVRAVGWLNGPDGSISLPNFDVNNGETAKKRALATKRQVTRRSRLRSDNGVTREDKRRINTPIPPSGAFLKFWNAWPRHTRKQSKGQCWERWRKFSLDAVAEEIVMHVEAMKRSTDWLKESGAFIPAPLAYLNQRRWEGADLGQQELRVAMP